jgi:hypothetical protein
MAKKLFSSFVVADVAWYFIQHIILEHICCAQNFPFSLVNKRVTLTAAVAALRLRIGGLGLESFFF